MTKEFLDKLVNEEIIIFAKEFFDFIKSGLVKRTLDGKFSETSMFSPNYSVMINMLILFKADNDFNKFKEYEDFLNTCIGLKFKEFIEVNSNFRFKYL